MGFKGIRDAVIACLKEGNVEHELRNFIDETNLLSTGEISNDEVCAFLRRCRGDQYETSPHHAHKETTVHIFKPEIKDAFGKPQVWYIKCYFIEPDVWFISVHPSNK